MIKNFLIRLVFFCFLFVAVIFICFAHQPRIVENGRTVIENPEVSQAFYGELNGSPEYFSINSKIPIKLYVGILVPDLPDIDTDLMVKITSEKGFEEILDGNKFEWEPFYEEFGGDYYLNGPEFTDDSFNDDYPHGVLVEPGLYEIEVTSSYNFGKYVLVVGELESFPFPEIINTIKTMPKLKADFFEKSPFSAFFNLIGLFIFGPVILVILVVVIAVFVIKKITKNRKKHKK